MKDKTKKVQITFRVHYLNYSLYFLISSFCFSHVSNLIIVVITIIKHQAMYLFKELFVENNLQTIQRISWTFSSFCWTALTTHKHFMKFSLFSCLKFRIYLLVSMDQLHPRMNTWNIWQNNVAVVMPIKRDAWHEMNANIIEFNILQLRRKYLNKILECCIWIIKLFNFCFSGWHAFRYYLSDYLVYLVDNIKYDHDIFMST